jgi:hypothetical protein
MFYDPGGATNRAILEMYDVIELDPLKEEQERT